MVNLNYNHLRYFQAVAHEGNLTRAAARLNVSQSAVSIQIRHLEKRLGQELFARRGRTLHLTEAGRIALDHADSIFATGRELVATLQEGGRQRQALRVGSFATLSRNFQLAFLRPLLGRTDVEVILRSGSAAELLSALTALHLDLVLTNEPPPSDALTSFVVQRLEHSVLILPTAASGLRMGFDGLLDRLGVTPNIAVEVDDMAMMRLFAREGIGLAVSPPIVVRDELASGAPVESAQLPDLTETFYGVSVERRFPNTLLSELLLQNA